MAVMYYLSSTLGDERVEWNPDDKNSVKRAKEFFKEKIDAGFRAFRMKKGQRQGELIEGFEEDAEAIALLPPVIGG
jgi:hypothetical protein